MSFACWRKCDFQTHTPRDPNWTGPRPLGLGEADSGGAPATAADVGAARAEWAKAFVDQCITESLRAVALTDHHEMVMVPYVQKAIKERRQAAPDLDLWFFPGMEITASGGKQCLIIFDADLSEEWRQQAQSKLGIADAYLNKLSAAGPRVKQLSCLYPDIAKLLDEFEGLHGKYIVLPNISQGNNHTVLTEGGHGDFRRMPYVGGYLDRAQTIDTLSPRNQTRLSGTDKTWSVNQIYPLPTSDSRSADFSNLGQNNSWIKLAEPTAEAIRQAFLGHRSRIRIETPKIPSLVVAAAEIEGSTILQTTALTVSPEFNAVIGGRGSGKSSFLEYVAFGTDRIQNLGDRRDAFEAMRDLAAEGYRTETGDTWRPRNGSHSSQTGKLTSAAIDARDYLRARKDRETSAHLPEGTLVAFTGGKDFDDVTAIWQSLDSIKIKYDDMVLLHGGGPGAEKIAASWAEKNGVHQVVCKPNWDRDGKAAPFRRNDVLLNFLPKGLLAFPGSGITNNLVDKARKIGIPVLLAAA